MKSKPYWELQQLGGNKRPLWLLNSENPKCANSTLVTYLYELIKKLLKLLIKSTYSYNLTPGTYCRGEKLVH